MERIWAPWRMAYINKHSDKTPCFMCAAVKSRRDASTHILVRGKTCIAILNKFPYTNGHVMIAPAGHRASLEDLDDTEMLEMMTLTRRLQRALDGAFHPQGYNLGVNLGRVAGAGLLGHIHLHIVPRWNGDTNFMGVTAGTRVIPMGLPKVHALIRKELKKHV